jgi:hypothetical protein
MLGSLGRKALDLRDLQGLLAIQRIYQTAIRSIIMEELAK